VLASASATRARLLDAAGMPVAQRPATVDELALKESLQAEGASAGDAAIALAELKAQQIARHMPEAIVLGADQILTCAGRWFDKPQDRAEARAQLGALAGKRHELATAVVAFRGGVRVWHHLAVARLWLRPCSPGFLDAYLDAVSDAALTSIGAYQIEHLGAQLLARIEGDHFAVLGLPVLEVLEFLRQQGVLRR
jgi:septum formation protein